MKLPYAVRPAAPLKQAKAWSDEQAHDRMHALLRHEQRALVKIFPVCLIFGTFFEKVREHANLKLQGIVMDFYSHHKTLKEKSARLSNHKVLRIKLYGDNDNT